MNLANNFAHRPIGQFAHVAQGGEDDKAGEEGGEAVDDGSHDGVP